MSDELERLKRLRERQLNDRNPQTKQNQIQRNITYRERKERGKKYTLLQAWQALPHVYTTPLIIFFIGLVATIVLTLFWNSLWAIAAGMGATIFVSLVGIFIGQAMDLRDNLRDFSKH